MAKLELVVVKFQDYASGIQNQIKPEEFIKKVAFNLHTSLKNKIKKSLSCEDRVTVFEFF